MSKFSSEAAAGEEKGDRNLGAEYQTLGQKLRMRETGEQIIAWLQALPGVAPENKLELLLHSLLELGSKSFSHLLNVLERYLRS